MWGSQSLQPRNQTFTYYVITYSAHTQKDVILHMLSTVIDGMDCVTGNGNAYQSIGSQCYRMRIHILFVPSKFHAWWRALIIQQRIVCPPNGVFTGTKMQAFPQTMCSVQLS